MQNGASTLRAVELGARTRKIEELAVRTPFLPVPSLLFFTLVASPLLGIACADKASERPALGATGGKGGPNDPKSPDGSPDVSPSDTEGIVITDEEKPPEENPCLGDNPPEDCQMVPTREACGDGALNQDGKEQCDDGNARPGDGCTGVCIIEANYKCLEPGKPCEFDFRCGNGALEPGEVCDDGNVEPDDGCGADCTEASVDYDCLEPGKPCVKVVQCGDGRVAGSETCEYRRDPEAGTLSPVEGCDESCHVLPGYVCRQPSLCQLQPRCGDGRVNPELNEACDAGDGNNAAGKGCAADCTYIESGFICAEPGQPCVSQVACGDGIVNGSETCDDANDVPDDGCDRCVRTEGYECPFPGAPCVPLCGDGIFLPNMEICDDGNRDDGDGCTSTCEWEDGWACSGTAPQYTCVRTTCGDGTKAGTESCDDGNNDLGDGCTPACNVEPTCEGGACTSACGDGLLLAGEACDDGNNRGGDGCSSSCQVEPGSECLQPGLGDTMVVPIVYRDFDESHADFEPGAVGCEDPTSGLVADTLGADGKPVQAVMSDDACSRANALDEWYSDSPSSTTVVDTLTLWLSDDGTSYVNRFGEDGEQYVATVDTGSEQGGYGEDQASCEATCTQRTRDNLQCENVCRPEHDQVAQTQRELQQAEDAQEPDAELIAELEAEIEALEEVAATCDADCATDFATREAACQASCLPCSYNAAQWCIGGEQVAFDGSPLFFPLDGRGQSPMAEYGGATIPDEVYFGNWQEDPSGELHNFHFTSEVRFWFAFDPSKSQVLTFTGDDDVWVFINNQLVVDLGGIHIPVSGSVDVTTAATRLGLEPNGVYEIVVFQAERQTSGSSYQLTLGGFNVAPSECRPICGDAVISPGEQCDNGDNPGGYGECNPDCTRGEYCGDSVLNGNEQCDDGVNLSAYGSSGCGPGCQLAASCGDAIVQGQFGEECDDGENAGAYGGCNPDCSRAPFCGDGKVDGDFGEECDDVLNDGTYNTCGVGCLLGPRCGDGVVQEDWGEACDGSEDCGSTCQPLGICGDGVKQDNEECDDGVNDGGYGECAPDCVLGPRCGDGVVQAEQEQCDAGEAGNTGNYGECAPGCVLGPHCGDGRLQPTFEFCDDGGVCAEGDDAGKSCPDESSCPGSYCMPQDKDGCSAACVEEISVPR